MTLTESKAKAGHNLPAKQYENFRSLTSLTLFQQGLGTSEVFLRLHLGKTDLLQWAVWDTRGERLCEKLLSGMNPAQSGKQARLVTARKGGKVKCLVQQHSPQVFPGALLFSRETGRPARGGWSWGVADSSKASGKGGGR